MTSDKKPVLEIRGLKTQFLLQEGTVTALDGIDLTINENESMGVVGETGCGKSMTAFSVLRLVPPPGSIEAGNVFFKEPGEVRNRRLRYESEGQAWYERQTLEKRRELFATYGPRLRGRKGRVRRYTRTEVRKMVPSDMAPHKLIMTYLSLKAKKIPDSDKVGKDAALCTYDLLNKSHDYMRGVRGKQISMIFQDPSTSLDPVFTVGQQLREVISLHQRIYDRSGLDSRVLKILGLVKIAAPETVMRLYPHELSGGMKQRVMIALALSCDPSLLIADEPTTALDVTIQAQVLNLLKEVVRGVGSSMMLITHNLGVVAETCDRVCIMYAGRIVEEARTLELFEEPLHPYTAGLLNAFPKLGERKDELSVIKGTVPNLMTPFPGCAFVERCERATDTCRKVRPSRVEVRPDHFVSCHLYAGGDDDGAA
jgi:oligopeptide/dipeptide ABC transporter ATP-binding protein